MKEKSPKVFTISNLYFLYNNGKLDMNPEYQRGSVWKRTQKQLLIDSLLNDLDIPKFYFRSIPNKPKEYEVVDGQQRLRTIFEFLHDEFSLSDESDTN